jgi:hypothetical protein
MGMSFGDPDGHDPPYSDVMNQARNTVKSALDKAGVAFYSGWNDDKMTEQQRLEFIIKELGSKMIGAPSKEYAEYGRKLTKRKMPV